MFYMARGYRSPVPPTIRGSSCVQYCGTTFSGSYLSQPDADHCAGINSIVCQDGACVGVTIENTCDVCRPAPHSFGGFLSIYDPNAPDNPPVGVCCDPNTVTGPVPPECCCVPDDPPPSIPDDPPGGDDPNTPTLFGNEPTVCASTCPDGSQNNFTVRAGYFIASSKALANSQAYSYACNQARAFRLCLGTIETKACVEQTYDSVLSADAGPSVKAPITFAITNGSLPPGVNLSEGAPGANEASLFGTPTAPGLYAFTITATSANGVSKSKDFQIEVYGCTCPSDGTLCSAYSSQLTGYPLTGATYSVSGLPCGLTCSAGGLISGTPYEDGTFTLSATITANGRSCTRSCTMKIAKNPAFITESASIKNLTWTTVHVGGGSGSGSGSDTGASATSTGPSVWDPGCQVLPSDTTVTSGLWRNCGVAYPVNIHIEWTLADSVCTQVAPAAHSAGQVAVYLGLGVIYQVLAGGTLGTEHPYSGSFDYQFMFLPSIGPSGTYFTLTARAQGASATMMLTVTITPSKPPPC